MKKSDFMDEREDAIFVRFVRVYVWYARVRIDAMCADLQTDLR